MNRFLSLVVVLLLAPALALADIAFDPRTAPADERRLNDLIAKCEGELRAFRELMAAIRGSSEAVNVFPGRDQPGVFVDVFRTDEIDLSDLERYANPAWDAEGRRWVFPPGVDRNASSLCENLAHLLYERYHESLVAGRGFEQSHGAANDYENRIRREFGQAGEIIDCNPDGLTDDAISTYRTRTGSFILQRDTLTIAPGGSIDIGGISTREVRVICWGTCAGPRPRTRVVSGADTCALCEAELAVQCGGALASSACIQ